MFVKFSFRKKFSKNFNKKFSYIYIEKDKEIEKFIFIPKPQKTEFVI